MSTAARIAFVAPFGLGQKTTVWARTLPLARQLVRCGHQVSLVIPPWDTPTDAGQHSTDAGVEIIQTSLSGGTVAILRRMLGVLADIDPQIVHIVKPRAHAGLVQWWLWRRRSIHRPAILLDIDDWEQAWAPINQYRWPLARFLAWQEEWGLRHADGVTAASRWLEDRVHQYSPQTPTLYLPNGVESAAQPGRPRPAPLGDRQSEEAGPQILFYTRFVEVEPAWLAEFWQSVHAHRPTAHLVVAGAALQHGREAAFQERMAAIGSAADHVEWAGFVTSAQQDALYRASDCAIFPAQNIPLLQAKCSVKLATTLLHDVPVVASAVGEQAAYGAEGAARLVDSAATPATFANAVLELLDTPGAPQAMIEAARRRLCTEYAWAKLGDRLAAFYEPWL